MTKKPHFSEDDREVWRAVAKQIEPHAKTDRHRKKRAHKDDAHQAQPAPPLKQTAKKKAEWRTLERDARRVPSMKQHAPVRELPALAPDVARHVASGKRGIDAQIDLHGLTQDGAHARILSFIARAAMRGHKTLLIITGKGKAGEGVLANLLPRWIAAHPDTARLVAGHAHAPRHLGGAGATIVTLKRKRS